MELSSSVCIGKTFNLALEPQVYDGEERKMKRKAIAGFVLAMVFFVLVFPMSTFSVAADSHDNSEGHGPNGEASSIGGIPISGISWTVGIRFPVVNGYTIFPTLVASMSPASSTHWYAGSVCSWWFSGEAARTIYMSIKVPYSTPRSDEFYYVLLSAWTDTGSYVQIGFSDDYGIWGLTYSWTSGPISNLTYHYSPNAMILSLGTTYTFYITTQGGITQFVAYQGLREVWSLDAPTGGSYLYLHYLNYGSYGYTNYEEVWQTSVLGGSPAFDFYFFNNCWVSLDGQVYATADWWTFSSDAPSNVAVIISGNTVFVDNPMATVLFETTHGLFGGTILFNGLTYILGQSAVFPPGNYAVAANASKGFRFDHWEYSGCLGSEIYVPNMKDNPTTAQVHGDGWLKAVFLGPFKVPQDLTTIQGAINAAYDGDAILVSSGTYYEHLVVDKAVSLIGENTSNTIIDGNLTGNVINITANMATVSGFTIQNSGKMLPNAGIYCGNGTDDHIIGNFITSNYFGIFLDSSSGNTINWNDIASNCFGIALERSCNCNSISENNITTNNNFGIMLEHFCNYNNVNENNITNNAFGIVLDYSSSNNSVNGNNVVINGEGILFGADACANTIFHNNFIANAQQAHTNNSANSWDDGYPSGGNYWSDYNGADADGDGVGDTPNTIDGCNQDKYPLMDIWTPPDIAVMNVAPSRTMVGKGSSFSIEVEVANKGNKIEGFDVTAYINETDFQTQYITLARRDSITIAFAWNTSGFVKGNYTIWALAWPLRNETDFSNNVCTGGWVIVTILGDVVAPYFEVDIYDITAICTCYDSKIGQPLYYANCDLDGNCIIDIFDVTTACITYGQKYL
jgi:nitrous oxidase accessory protein NosD